jgi:ABC-2 type transport system permease protein
MISYGARTLLRRELKRFWRVAGQTLVSPLVTNSLYFTIFGLSIGSQIRLIDGVPYLSFMVPGLVTMGVLTNAFLNTSSSLFSMKMQGTLVDLLVTPLTHGEWLFAFITAAVVRGMSVGAMTWLVALAFTGVEVAHPLLTIVLLIGVAVAFAALGLIVAIWAEKFEQINFVPAFVMQPLTFLGGVFYSVRQVPEVLKHLTHANPIFYLVDSVRFAMLGQGDGDPVLGISLLVVTMAVSLLASWALLRSGYKLRG